MLERVVYSKLLPSTQETDDALVTPLLARSDVVSDQGDDPDLASAAAGLFGSSSGMEMSGAPTSNGDITRMISSPTLRRIVIQVVQVKSAADSLPSLFFTVVTNGKFSLMVFTAAYLIFISLWFPFWLLSFVTTEWGVYLLAVGTIFFIGRSIIRLIAFPGASQKVTAEIEAEFARYSVRMVTSAADSVIEVTSILSGSDKSGGDSTSASSNFSTSYELPGLWRRARSYCDRVLGVYLEVLLYIFQQPSESSISNAASDLTKYGNNRVAGDIGSLSGVTVRVFVQILDLDFVCLLAFCSLFIFLSYLNPHNIQPQAKVDGRELMERLQSILRQVDQLEQQAAPVLSAGRGTTASGPLSEEARATARTLLSSARELRDFVSSLKPPSGSGEEQEDEGDEDLTVDAVRRKFEAQSGSAVEAVKNGLASILPMLDPPPHTSVFGFDVLRGCMLSRYRGSRQLWVARPNGGLIDVLHFPAKQKGSTLPRNHRAVLYCNPNAGLIEVATGMSLVGGNVPTADSDNSSQDNSWIDFYTDLGIDVYIFNYAGYGRSFGTTLCASGKNAGENYQTGILARLGRIFRASFLSFQPTPDSLRADGIAVAHHMLHEIGVEQLIIHGESIGGVAASGTARRLSESPATRGKLALVICDRTFCNLEAVAQRLVGGWTGYAIRGLAPFWNTDVAGDFLAATCPKVLANDAADAIINDAASLKSGVAIWKEMHRGVATTKGIGWMTEAPLQYRMADWENVCVTDSKYAAGTLIRAQPPVWPTDRHVSLEEAFHFAACCKRIGKIATQTSKRSNGDEESAGFEMDENLNVLSSQQPLVMEAWRTIACCDGLTGAPLGVSVKRGFDSTVAWLCSCLTFGGQAIVAVAERRTQNDGRSLDRGPLEIVDADFDTRPPGYVQQERDGMVHPKPIPEVVERIVFYLESGDEVISKRK